MSSIQKCYKTSTWVELESLAQNFLMQNSDRQLKATAMIVKGYSFRYKRGMRVFKCLSEAQKIACGINGSNHYFLLARCKHTEATIHQFSGEDNKSLKENNEALYLLCDCAFGDDALLVMYAIACARQEKLGKTQCNHPL